MIPDPSQDPTLSPAGEAWKAAQRFSHEAMATTFEMFIAGKDPTYAAQAAADAFQRCDRLEEFLSRYKDSSDISRLNRAPVQTPVLLSLETFNCLQQAADLYRLTEKTFDVTVGRWTRDTQAAGPRRPREAFPIDLDEDRLCASRLFETVQVDLGGIGKGFALDVMAQQLREWGVTQALLHGGGSTVLALEGPAPGEGWPLTLRDPLDSESILRIVPLVRAALSGSSHLRRSHIVDPRTGRRVEGRLSAWSLAPLGGWADGLSTAFMIMPAASIRALCQARPELAGVTVSRQPSGTRIETYGVWPD
jgi:thiamine biosynthesis lipoprotein